MVKRQIPISTSKSITIEPHQYRVRDPLGTRGVVVSCCLLLRLPHAWLQRVEQPQIAQALPHGGAVGVLLPRDPPMPLDCQFIYFPCSLCLSALCALSCMPFGRRELPLPRPPPLPTCMPSQTWFLLAHLTLVPQATALMPSPAPCPPSPRPRFASPAVVCPSVPAHERLRLLQGTPALV